MRTRLETEGTWKLEDINGKPAHDYRSLRCAKTGSLRRAQAEVNVQLLANLFDQRAEILDAGED